jgi:hypothetical protein
MVALEKVQGEPVHPVAPRLANWHSPWRITRERIMIFSKPSSKIVARAAAVLRSAAMIAPAPALAQAREKPDIVLLV